MLRLGDVSLRPLLSNQEGAATLKKKRALFPGVQFEIQKKKKGRIQISDPPKPNPDARLPINAAIVR